MKTKFLTFLFLFVLIISLFTACNNTNINDNGTGVVGDDNVSVNDSSVEEDLTNDLIGDNDTVELGEII